jgi:hypothetical protein
VGYSFWLEIEKPRVRPRGQTGYSVPRQTLQTYCADGECAARALRLVGRTLPPPPVINIFCRGGRGEAAGRINEAKLSIGIDVSREQRCSHRDLLLNGPLDQGPRRSPRFSAFSLSFCADSQAIAVAFRLPVRPNPPFRSQSRSEASRRAAPPPVSGRQ